MKFEFHIQIYKIRNGLPETVNRKKVIQRQRPNEKGQNDTQ